MERKVDFPTLGNPISPTSAMSLSSRITSYSLAFCPLSAYLGACLVGVAKCWLPLPPFPPLIMTFSSPFLVISAIILFVEASLMTVPLGTFITTLCPSLPKRFLFPPACPGSALNILLNLKSIRVLIFSSPTKITLPPFPPSPPSGPPWVIYFAL